LLWAAVEFLVGDLWPNGDPSAMRSAAASWRTFASALYGVSGEMSAPYNVIGAQQMDEAELIKAPIRDIGSMMSSIAGTCQTLAGELDAFAGDVEKTQQAVRDLLSKLGSIGGIVGTFFEFLKGHGEDELHEIADDIRTVLSHMKSEVDAKKATLEAVKQNVDNWALSLEGFADRTFVDFFGEDVGRFLAVNVNMAVDAEEGGFRWLVGTVEGLSDMDPMRFAYDPHGALQTWDGIGKFAALANPALAATVVASDPEGVKNMLKGLARTDEWCAQRPMLGLSQNVLDVASLAIPGVGEAGAAVDAASVAGRTARVGELAEEASGVARVTGKVSEVARATGSLADISKQTAGITGKLDEIAGKPVSLEPPTGRAVTPTRPAEPAPGPVTTKTPEPVTPPAAKPVAPDSAVPRPNASSESPIPVAPLPERVPATAPSDGVAPTPSSPHPATAPHVGAPGGPSPGVSAAPHTAPTQAPPAPHSPPLQAPIHSTPTEHAPTNGPRPGDPGPGPGPGEHAPHRGDEHTDSPHDGTTHDGGTHDGGTHDGAEDGNDLSHHGTPDDTPEHLPNHEVQTDAHQPGASTEPHHQPVTNEPVDVATGEYLLPAVDVTLPGVLPLRLTRRHRSQYRHGRWFGPTWASTLDSRAVITDSEVTTIDADGTMQTFDRPAPGRPSTARRGQRWTLHAEPSGAYRLDDPSASRSMVFAPLPQRAGTDMAAGVLSLSAITDRNRNRIDFVYNEIGVPLRIEHSGGTTVDVECRGGRVRGYSVNGVLVRRFGYDDGNLAAVTNAVGATTEFGYDDARRMVSWTDSGGGHYTNTYDTQGRVISQTGTGGVWSGTFDYRDERDGRRTVFADALGNATTYRFDAELRPIAVNDPTGRTRRTAFAEAADPAAVVDAGGATTSYRYDTDGHLAEVADPLGRVLAFTYTDGRPTRMQDPDGAVTCYEYDRRGNLVTAFDAAGGVHAWLHDASGAVSAHIDPLGRRTEILNSAAGLPERVTDAMGNQTSLRYDEFGRPISVVDTEGAVTTMTYDAEGRQTARVGPDGARESWSYDGEGNCVAFTSASGATTRWEYGYYDLVTARIDADGARTEYGYNVARQFVSVTNPAGLVWRYEYRRDGSLGFETDFNGATTSYGYDAAGRLASRTNAAGQAIHYRYDPAGNLVSETSSADAVFPRETVTYEYDAVGRRAAASNTAGRLDLTRDAMGRVTAESWNGRSVVSTFNAAGELIEVRTPSGLPAQLSYDARGVAESLTVAGRPCQVSTDALGRATTYRYGLTEVDSSWDAAGRLTARSVNADHGALASAQYRYRRGGELSDVQHSGAAAALGTIARFDTDAVGRLTTQTLADGSRHKFRFDRSENLGAGTQRWEYSGVMLVDDGRSRYSYDRAGRLTTVSTRRLGRKPDVWLYSWDAWDRLRTLATPDGTTFRYSYDPMGRRVAKHGSTGGRVEFAWSGTRMVEQVTAGGPERCVTSWAYLPGELSPQIQVSQTDVDREFFALVTDQVGAPVAVLDPRNGTIAGQSSMSAWGLAQWTGVSTPWRFPGQYHDEESGLHYNFYRYYHPGTARYISPDPLGLAPAPNPYSYPTNPTGWVDPLGLNPCKGGQGDVPGPPREITNHGLLHSFSRHAHEWLGMQQELVSWSQYGPKWQEMIERATTSRAVVDWRAGRTLTYGHFVRYMEDGKPFLVQFDRQTGELVTAFRPDAAQLAEIRRILGGYR
jgi:RHS repeat-associated protein